MRGPDAAGFRTLRRFRLRLRRRCAHSLARAPLPEPTFPLPAPPPAGTLLAARAHHHHLAAALGSTYSRGRARGRERERGANLPDPPWLRLLTSLRNTLPVQPRGHHAMEEGCDVWCDSLADLISVRSSAWEASGCRGSSIS